MAFFPSYFGVSNVGYNGGDNGSDKGREPDEIVVFDDEI